MRVTVVAPRVPTPRAARELRSPRPGSRLLSLTTPRRLWLGSMIVFGGLVAFAVVGGLAASKRLDAAGDVGREAAPFLVGAQDLSVALADAHASTSRAFLQAGFEQADAGNVVVEDVRERAAAAATAPVLVAPGLASGQLATIARQAGASDEVLDAIAVLTERLPVYTGLVAAARANTHENVEIGAAYLRQASDIMREEILPAASLVYEGAVHQLGDTYGSGTSTREALTVMLVGTALIIFLVALQVDVAQRSRRVFNLGLLGASMLVVAVGSLRAPT